MFSSAHRRNTSRRLLARGLAGALVAAAALAFAPPPAISPVALGIDFRQAANLGPPLGDITWINSILQQNNSLYAEGMSVPQRLVFVEIPATQGNNHRLLFSHQATKGGGIHAYDFLTSWDQAIEAAKGKGLNGENLLDNLAIPSVICGPNLGPQVTQQICDSLWSPAANPVVAKGNLPDNMGTIGGGTGNVAQQVIDYEASLGNREITVRAPNGNPVSNVVCNFLGYTVGNDNYAEYELLWTSASTTIAIEFAGHLGVGDAEGIVSGYGTGWGASAISGGPYHFKLSQLDGASLGSQDNQIKGADIIIPPPVCVLNGPTTACQGQTGLVFNNGAVPDPTITYQWSFLSNTSGASFTSATNTNQVTVNAGASAGSFEIQLSKTNPGGTTLCSQVVTVQAATQTTDPANQTVCEGANVSFCTTASGTGPFTYQWAKGGVDIPGATNSCLELNAVTPASAGEYCVTVTGFCGTAQQCATLTVNQTVAATTPSNATACVGGNVQFCTTASGTGPFTYQWKKNGVNIGGATNSCLSLNNVVLGDAGTYCVAVNGACGSTEKCATLTVNSPTVTSKPADVTTCTGEDVQFCTTASGTGPFTYQWKKNGVDIPGATNSCLQLDDVAMGAAGEYCVTTTGPCGSDTKCAVLNLNQGTNATLPGDKVACPGDNVTFCTTASGTGPFTYQWKKNGVNIAGATNSCLTLNGVVAGDAGTYCVAVAGACNTVERCATLTVNTQTTTTNPGNKTACVGGNVSFCTTASGTGPFTYQWKKNGVDIPGATNSCLQLNGVTAGSAGEYCVTVNGACGSDTECATLTVNNPPVASNPGNKVACGLDDVTFCTTASGTGPFTYQWKKDGVNISGATNSCLTLLGVDDASEGQYCVAVTGACGTTEACGTLDVLPTTRITALLDATVCPGTDVTFFTMASGAGPFTYQWSKDGVDIPGATNTSLTIPSVELGDAGEYCVKATGQCGSETKCADLDVMLCSEVFCTFTQGFYGNYGGKFNGVPTADLIEDLMSSGPLVLGKLGTRSVTIPSAAWECILARLPAGGPAETLPDFGDQTMSGFPNCAVPMLPLKNGKFRNVLLGQVVTLSLNTRLDAGLGGVELCNLMKTQAVLPGDDGLFGTADDEADPGPDGILGTLDDDVITVLISPSVISALSNLGLPNTVAGLLELANRALAGLPTGGASISAINSAVDAINRGFDECRLLISCQAL